MKNLEFYETKCTGCGLCIRVCPVGCIEWKIDKMGARIPFVDNGKCIECGKCELYCPVLTEISRAEPKKAYAVISSDDHFYRNAASGGVASSMYQYAIENDWKAIGVSYEKNRVAEFIEVNHESDILKVRNSKYVFSDISGMFDTVKDWVLKGNKVLIIALPCQIAACKSMLRDIDSRVVYVDIVCHGTPPVKYLNEHIDFIDRKMKGKSDEVSFRDPEFGTENFIFTLRKDKKLTYSANVFGRDNFQLGYHRALIYRENCYACHFANKKRTGDITIADYPGLGLSKPFDFSLISGKKTSVMLISTDNGTLFVNALIDAGKINAVERPIEEPFIYNRQLSLPSKKNPRREKFVKRYKSTQSFDKAASYALFAYTLIERIKGVIHYDRIRIIFHGDNGIDNNK